MSLFVLPCRCHQPPIRADRPDELKTDGQAVLALVGGHGNPRQARGIHEAGERAMIGGPPTSAAHGMAPVDGVMIRS